MQRDAGFARAMLAQDPAAEATTGLTAPDLSLLLGLDPRALAADPGGRASSQLLGNSASEFKLSLAAAMGHTKLPAALGEFQTSAHFHRALMGEGRLPLAFGQFLLETAKSLGAGQLIGIIELELSMAWLRRAQASTSIPSPHPPRGNWPPDRSAPSSVPEILPNLTVLPPGFARLAQGVRLLALPKGTFNWAMELQEAMDRGDTTCPKPGRETSSGAHEWVLIQRTEPASAFQLPAVQPELLTAPTDALLKLCQTAASPAERRAFAEARGVTEEDLGAFLQGLVLDRILDLGAS